LGLHDVKPCKARFHFEAFWTKLDGFQETVEAAWNSVPVTPRPFITLAKKFEATVKNLEVWLRNRLKHHSLALSSLQRTIARSH